jgi:hypothetical protein
MELVRHHRVSISWPRLQVAHRVDRWREFVATRSCNMSLTCLRCRQQTHSPQALPLLVQLLPW